MKIDLRPRGAGKTAKMIEDAASGFFYIVCHSQQEAYRISQLAIEMGLDIPFPLAYAEFIVHHKVKTTGFQPVSFS